MSDSTPPSRQLPFREDCWSEEATSTLVDSWGRRYVELNRGNLRQKDWQEVADTVNNLHGHTKKTRRTDVQCKNRIDTLKKKYKVEKAKIAEFNGNINSSWPFFARLDVLIGPNYDKLQKTNKLSNLGLEFRNSPSILNDFDSPPMAVPLLYRNMALPPPPVAVLSLPQKRKREGMDGESFRRNYSAMAAAAAKEVMEDEEDEEEEREGEEEEEGGMRKLVKEIERFGEIYERVEEMKQRQMVELEKRRMEFTKDLEVQRMQLFMDTQVQLEKIKRVKRSGGGSDDGIDVNVSEVFQQFNQFICNFM